MPSRRYMGLESLGKNNCCRRTLGNTAWLLIFLLVGIGCQTTQGQNIPIEIPDGFQITQFADDELATNIYSMTINSDGQVVVAGPGYIKTLLDTDGDGQADRAKLFADQPRQGAQGLFFEGNDLYATGDGGLLFFADRDGDGVADGPPKNLLPLKTGGEHDAHAIRRGPDGWLYVLCGNGVPIKKEYYSGPRSPVKNPRAGFLMRISPDFQTREIHCHGFRNAYDFDFDLIGDVFVYDSDGERDVSMPWYRPTRVFQMLPGDDAGFVSPNWKRPGYFYDMPNVAARLGRGSPTGVVCYRHRQFPKKYFNSIFVLDWTFGRIVAVRHDANGKFSHELFAAGKETFGFAPTDIEVAPDGSIYVSVGGRGTRGGVYRISYQKNLGRKPRGGVFTDQPLSSWAMKLTKANSSDWTVQKYLDFARDDRNTALDRIQSVDRIVAKSQDLENSVIRFGSMVNSKNSPELNAKLVKLDCLHGIEQAKSALLGKMVEHDIVAPPVMAILKRHRIFFSHAYPAGGGVFHHWAEKAIENLPVDKTRDEIHSIRTNQLLVGFAKKPTAGVFSSYEGDGKDAATRSSPATTFANIRDLFENQFAQSSTPGKLEIARLAAMSVPAYRENATAMELVRDKLIGQLADDSDPIHDIHYLICLSVIDPKFGKSQLNKITDSLVNLVPKIIELKYARDRNWPRHIRDAVNRLIKNQPDLRQMIAEHFKFAIPENEYLFFVASGEQRKKVAAKLAERVRQNPEHDLVNRRIVSFVAEEIRSDDALFDQLWRRPELRNSLIQLISRKPRPEQLDKFVVGLQSSDMGTARRCANVLMKLKQPMSGKIVVTAVRNLVRLGWDNNDQPIREQMIKLLQQQTGRDFGFVAGEPGRVEQKKVLDQWKSFAREKFPKEFQGVFKNADVAAWTRETLAKTDWQAGNAANGQKLYRSLSCAKCHDGARSSGPQLAGITRRFNKNDLFKTITQPDDQVSSRYRTIVIETTSGEIHKGLIVYESVDGLTMINGQNETVRIENDEIDFRQTSMTSMMPAGLLDKTKPSDWADLYEYLKTLK